MCPGRSGHDRGFAATAVPVTDGAVQLALLDTLFETAPLGIGLWDRELRYVRVNDWLAEIHGVPAAAHVGRTIGEVAGELGASVETTIRGVVDTGVPVRDRLVSGELPTLPGKLRHWRASWIPVRDGERIVGAAALVEELTEQVTAERERDALLGTERALRRRAEFLARAAELLDASLHHEEMLSRVAHIAVPDVAAWCAVDLL